MTPSQTLTETDLSPKLKILIRSFIKKVKTKRRDYSVTEEMIKCDSQCRAFSVNLRISSRFGW